MRANKKIRTSAQITCAHDRSSLWGPDGVPPEIKLLRASFSEKYPNCNFSKRANTAIDKIIWDKSPTLGALIDWINANGLHNFLKIRSAGAKTCGEILAELCKRRLIHAERIKKEVPAEVYQEFCSFL